MTVLPVLTIGVPSGAIWSWPGWTAVSSIGTVIAALGTIAAFFVIYGQLRHAQLEAIERKHDAITPLFAITFEKQTPAREHGRIEADLVVALAGNGVANTIDLTLTCKVSSHTGELDFRPMQYRLAVLMAPTTHNIHVSWRKPGQDIGATIRIEFINALKRRSRWSGEVIFGADGVGGSGASQEVIGG